MSKTKPKELMKLSPEEKLREQYKRNVRLFVQRLIKMAKEQIVVGRNYGWTQDSMSQELILFIDKEISLAEKRGEESVVFNKNNALACLRAVESFLESLPIINQPKKK